MRKLPSAKATPKLAAPSAGAMAKSNKPVKPVKMKSGKLSASSAARIRAKANRMLGGSGVAAY